MSKDAVTILLPAVGTFVGVALTLIVQNLQSIRQRKYDFRMRTFDLKLETYSRFLLFVRDVRAIAEKNENDKQLLEDFGKLLEEASKNQVEERMEKLSRFESQMPDSEIRLSKMSRDALKIQSGDDSRSDFAVLIEELLVVSASLELLAPKEVREAAHALMERVVAKKDVAKAELDFIDAMRKDIEIL